MGCKGVETKVYQLDKEYEESVQVEGLSLIHICCNIFSGTPK